MIRYDLEEDVTDEVLEQNLQPFLDKISKYIKDNVANDFVAADIAIAYQTDALYAEPFDVVIGGALDDLAQTTNSFCNKDEIKKILEEKHHLKIINDNPIELEEIKDKWSPFCLEGMIIMNNEKLIKEKLRVFEKLISSGYNTDKKILDMKIEDIILLSNFTRTDLNIAVGIKQALLSKSLVSYICGTDNKN